MRSHLIPKPVVDKNGRTVLRYFRNPPSAAVKIPKVTIPPALLEQEKRVTAMLESMVRADPEYERASDMIANIIADYSPHTLSAMSVLADDLQMVAAVYAGLTTDWTETTVVDYLHLEDIFRNNKDWYLDMEYYLHSLPHYEDLCPLSDDGQYPVERRAQCEAIFDLLHYMEDPWDYDVYADVNGPRTEVPFILERKLRKLILTSDRREQVVLIIKERKLLDADQIEELMGMDKEANAPVLSSGAL